jgi:hypothetical protein
LRPLFLEAKTNSLLPDDENKEEDVVEDEVDAIADDTLLVNIFGFPLLLSRRRGSTHERKRVYQR